MKKILSIILPFLILFPLCITMQSCRAAEVYSEGSGELKVVCTTFAPFDFARVVGGDRVTVSLLQDSGADLHNYTPTVATLDAISDADIFIYIGGASDAWVEKTVEAAGNPDLVTVRLMEFVDPVHAELENDWSSHSSESHHNHDHGHDHGDHDHGADEHIWTSVKNAAAMVNAIKASFVKLDPDGNAEYEENAAKYCSELAALDAELEQISRVIGERPMLFADRFPFVYLMHDYHIPYMAAFSGCSSETNSGFEVQVGLINAVKVHSLDFVVTLEGGDKSIAEAIANETGCRMISLDSLQSVSKADIISGKTYLSTMKQNIRAIKEAYHVTDQM